jgi:hypothetical protein
MANPSSPIDLGNLFQTVTAALARSKESLNNADTSNHDHGDNMVNTFELITRAVNEKKGASPSDQLAYAAGILGQLKSGSAQLYAKGLSQASQLFQGQQITSDNVMTLIPTLLGIGEAPVQQSASGGGQAPVQQSFQIMISPADGAFVSGDSINFQWKVAPMSARDARYWLSVKRVKDGSPRISKDLGNVLSSDEQGFANDGTQYKWTVGINSNPDSNTAAVYWTFTNGAPPEPQQQPKQQVQQQQQEAGINDIIGTLIRKAQNQPLGQQQQQGAGINDIIGTLIRKAQNQPQDRQQQQGTGINDIIGTLIRQAQQPQAGPQSKSSGGVNLEAIVNGLVSNSAMGGSYRSQSGSVVANALIAAVQGMANKK